SADTCSTSDSPVSDASAVTALRNVSLDTAAPSFFAAAAITLSDVTNSARWVAYRANAVSPDSTPSTPALSGVLSARRACMRDGSPTINATMTLSSTATATMINELARYRHTASTSRGDGSSSMTSFSLGGHAERSVQPTDRHRLPAPQPVRVTRSRRPAITAVMDLRTTVLRELTAPRFGLSAKLSKAILV